VVLSGAMPRAPLRIAIARIAQESNCFSRLPTTLADFRATHYVEGERLLEACSPWGDELPGYIRNAELTGAVDALREDGAVEIVPISSAWAIPSGPLTKDTFDTLVGRLCEDTRAAGPLDGVVLSLHGAMGASGIADPDTTIVRELKRAVPVPVAVTHDLHAALTEARVRVCDVLSLYRTNPHRDHRRTGRLAARGLLAMLREGARPETAWRSLPMILGGGTTVDFLQPVRSIFRRLAELHEDRRILTAGVTFCHPWNDEPALGWASHVTTRGERALAEDLAEELAEQLWAVRHEAPPAFSTIDQAIREARAATLARKLGCVVLSDASDVVSAGAEGDNLLVLKALFEDARDLASLASIRDATSVETLFRAAEGTFVDVTLAGSWEVCGKVKQRLVHPVLGKMAVLDLGHLKIVVTAGPPLSVKPSFFSDLGLSPWRADIVVVKNFFPFRMFFLPVARKVIYVKTQGATDLDAAFKLPFDGPVHPRDEVSDWRARDRARRG
jgi:microcystin degradation protein MlrC